MIFLSFGYTSLALWEWLTATFKILPLPAELAGDDVMAQYGVGETAAILATSTLTEDHNALSTITAV